MGLQPAWCHGLLRAHLDQRLEVRRRFERGPARQGFVEDRAQGINIDRGAYVLRIAERLLRRHVAGRAQDDAGARLLSLFPRLVELFGQTEVGDFGLVSSES